MSDMKHLLLTALLLSFAAASQAQERNVPKDSERISIPGCAKGRTFIVVYPSTPEPVRSDVQPGRRFRLSASKKILDDLEKQEGTMVEVTGLVRKSQLSGPGGVSIAGGRVRIGGAPVSSDPRRDSAYNEAVMDVESWRSLPDPCRLP
jgi:hypothetical protein